MTTNGTAVAWPGAAFRKSSYSGGANGGCVELAWRKSRHSGGQNGGCVEIARTDMLFGVRDSKQADSPVLAVTAEHGRAFLAAVKGGQFSLP